jgi:hypothetical protein
MAEELRHTLTNLEVTPPEGVWHAIASRLDAEFDASDISLSQKITEIELAPPANAWRHIEAAIGSAVEDAAIVHDAEEKEAAPVVTFNRPFRRWFGAAAAILVMAVGAWYFLTDRTTDNTTHNAATIIPQPNSAQQQIVPGAPAEVPDVAVASNADDRPHPRASRPVIASAGRLNVAQANYPFEEEPQQFQEFAEDEELPHANLKYIKSISTSDVPTVEAPPIRDANGNIILDKELITASDHNYITVTGPNGEQTRISSKFLPLLTSLNSSTEPADYFSFFLNENNIWKLRFNEWRDRMLKQATLIPTATNLLDLLELKEILQEN